jgi:hypothetical protein
LGSWPALRHSPSLGSQVWFEPADLPILIAGLTEWLRLNYSRDPYMPDTVWRKVRNGAYTRIKGRGELLHPKQRP